MAPKLEYSERYLEGLVGSSVKSILNNQNSAGAIVASPDFAEYHFCWLRDASFCSYALDLVSESSASARYHEWVRRAVEGICPLMTEVTDAHRRGEELNADKMPPARFSMDGSMVHDDWPNFQIDGYGTWLWSLEQHLKLSGRSTLPGEFFRVVRTVSDYLNEFAMTSCFDVWEENGTDRHTSTLASIFGGLMAGGRMLEDDLLESRAEEVREFIVTLGRENGHFTKSNANDDVDGSIVWLSTPFGVIESSDSLFTTTVSLIRSRLMLDGGIRRYPTDVYFGSGAWPVLTASLGWHFVNAGNYEEAGRCLDWVIGKFQEGLLGEQFGGESRDRPNYDLWVNRWGVPAQDLMWSHAMFIILVNALTNETPSLIGSSTSVEFRVGSEDMPGGHTI